MAIFKIIFYENVSLSYALHYPTTFSLHPLLSFLWSLTYWVLPCVTFNGMPFDKNFNPEVCIALKKRSSHDYYEKYKHHRKTRKLHRKCSSKISWVLEFCYKIGKTLQYDKQELRLEMSKCIGVSKSHYG